MAASYADPHYADERIAIRKLSVGPTDNNVYVLIDPTTRASVLVDASDELERLVAAVADTNVEAIWLTHGDGDHIRVLEPLREALKVPVYMHQADAGALKRPPDARLNDGEVLPVGRLEFKVLHTPGHTAGGVCFHTDGHLIAGDTLFPGGPGNTKRPGGDFPLIIRMIREKLFVLPDDTRVYPGHGRDTTIGAERPHLDEWIARGW
ncbi:MAG TPA: MBL fold metallo-hydrolase [Chloroflexota bacterium]|jgi:glyoxylase-like metal-dependent hydrolase (beta-lactamase superfamily II)|nr:MBL fold metallo-hydrolase [Chloroflexota bacterium]